MIRIVAPSVFSEPTASIISIIAACCQQADAEESHADDAYLSSHYHLEKGFDDADDARCPFWNTEGRRCR